MNEVFHQAVYDMSTVYDDLGNVKKRRDARGCETEFVLDSYSNVVQVKSPEDRVDTVTYNANHLSGGSWGHITYLDIVLASAIVGAWPNGTSGFDYRFFLARLDHAADQAFTLYGGQLLVAFQADQVVLIPRDFSSLQIACKVKPSVRSRRIRPMASCFFVFS